MGERKGVNKYYPPDFDYKKHGSLDRYHNSHPLRERARKLKSEGILIIRFEMPYNIWCNGCNSHIGMGVRYNSEKKQVGKYYSTIIYKFRMKCHLCEQHFEIQTDPANCEYVILSGARRKEERWNAKDNEQIEMTDHEVKKQLMTDPMFKLEHSVKDKRKLQSVAPTLGEIQDLQSSKKDDYLLNKALRKTFREQKKKAEHTNKIDKELLQKSSLDIALVKETEEDKKMAGLIKYHTVTSLGTNHDEIRDKIINQPILRSTQKPKQSAQFASLVSLSNLTPEKSGSSVNTINAKNLGIKIGKRKQSETNCSPPGKLLITAISPHKSEDETNKLNNNDVAASYVNTTICGSNQTESKSKHCLNRVEHGINEDKELDKTFTSMTTNSLLVANYSSDDDDES